MPSAARWRRRWRRLEWTGAVGILQDDDLLHAARLTSETAAAVVERKGQDGRRYVYLGPRLDAPPMDVFEGAILFDEPGVKAVEFTQRAHGLAHFLRATSGAGALLALLGRRAPEIRHLRRWLGSIIQELDLPRPLVAGWFAASSAGCLFSSPEGRADLPLHRSRNRIMSRWYLVLIGTLFAQTLSAQGTVVRPEPRLDAGRAALRDALLQFRDSLNTIDAAASRLQRDYRESSTASLISRARVMREACARSVPSGPPARQGGARGRGIQRTRQLQLRRRDGGGPGSAPEGAHPMRIRLRHHEPGGAGGRSVGATETTGQGGSRRPFGSTRAPLGQFLSASWASRLPRWAAKPDLWLARTGTTMWIHMSTLC